MPKLNELIIEVCLKIAKRNEGALIVVGEAKYKPLVNQDIKEFDVIENPKLLESLCLMDGAVVIKHNGILEAYGVKLKSNLIWKNFGTRHASGLTASNNPNTTAYVVSEEDNKIRIFKEGKLLSEIDSRTKDIEKKIPQITTILESIGVGTLGTIGAGMIAPSLGLVIIPGVIIFGGSYYLINKIKEYFKGT